MNKQDIISYETDASQIKGKAKEVFFPESIHEVRNIVLSEKNICIRGGGSGLVGSAIPQNGQDIIIDTSKLKKYGAIDLARKTIEVESGVILQDLQNHLKKYNLEFPVSPTSRNICTIGGMVATNATDARGVKYKDTEEWVRWVEVMNAQGKVDRFGKTEISDYAGMEGITGLIVKVCLNLIEKKERSATLLKIQDPKKIIQVVKHLKKDRNVSIIEFIDRKISRLLDLEDKYHIIIEYEDDTGLLKNEEYHELISKIDEIYFKLANEKYSRIEDPKVSIEKFQEILEWCEIKNIPLFASVGTGQLHVGFYSEQEKLIPEMAKLIRRVNGKLANQYGIGIVKKEFVEPNDRKILENIKKRTDPENKFNQKKIL